jgi:hypothetical protein
VKAKSKEREERELKQLP